MMWCIFVGLCLFAGHCLANPMMGRQDTMNYLMAYGFAGESNPNPRIAALMNEDEDMAMEMGLRMFQRRYGLVESGVMDEATSELMSMPRCGRPDITMQDETMSMDVGKRRRRRFSVEGRRWPSNDLTYRIYRYTRDMTQSQVDSEIRRAFQVWSDVTPLTFTRITSGTPDIIIQFVSGDHGDGNAFDGPGGVLAHAFLPFSGAAIEGDSHFDEAETWTLYSSAGTNLFQVAAHEFGHALGLGHSEIQSALMAPFYRGYIPDFTLPYDDILGIQSLYGTDDGDDDMGGNGGGDGGNPVTLPPNMPNFCRNPTIDAITYTIENGASRLTVFQGDYYAYISRSSIVDGYPRRISDDWSRVAAGGIDAALHLERDERTYTTAYTLLFKGSYYYVYGDDRTLIGGRRSISDLGLPSNIDAIFVFARNGRIYAFKGNQYYRLTRQTNVDRLLSMDAYYPRDSSIWNLPFTPVGSALKSGSYNYFFHDTTFYRYDNYNLRVVSGYPRDNADIFGCRNLVVPETVDAGANAADNAADDATGGADSQTLSYVTCMLANGLVLLFVLCVF